MGRHDVRLHRTARKRLGNRVVGEIELTGDALDLTGDGLIMIAYSAAPGSQAEDQLKLLAAWSATARTPASEAAGTNPCPVEPGSGRAGSRGDASGPADRYQVLPYLTACLWSSPSAVVDLGIRSEPFVKRLLVPSAALLWGLQIAFLIPTLALILVTLYGVDR